MSDTRAAIRELRSLGEKRSTQGLTEQEQSRLAELRERLGLPSEPADGRSGGPRPGSAPPAAAPVPSPAAPIGPTPTAPSFVASATPPPPAGVGGLPRLDVPGGPTPLPSFANAPGGTPPGLDAASNAAVEPLRTGDAVLEPPPSFPELLEVALGGSVEAPETNQAPSELAPDASGATMQASDGGFDPAQMLSKLAPDALDATMQASDGGFDPAQMLSKLAPDALDATMQASDGGFDPAQTLPELAPDALDATMQAADGGFDPAQALPELAPDALDATPQGDAPLEPDRALTDLAAALPADAPLADAADAWTGHEVAALSPAEPGQTGGLEPPATPRRSSLAERIDAEFGPLDSETAPPEEAPAWGATREPILLEQVMQEDPGTETAPETFTPADLGAIPLDVADPATEPSFGGPGAPIELSSADVELLEGEPTLEPDLGGEPADPVPLAALHEFVGEQPADPRALAFDDQGDEPAFAPEDLVATGAELASAADAFHPAGEETSLQPKAAPAPAAPRIAVPRPPAGPPPSRPAPVPQPPRAPLAAASPAPVPATARAPAAAAAVPKISAAKPESPRAGFGQSGPFARAPAVLMAPAPLDVMDEGMDESLGVQEPVAAPPITDIAIGAEVFGGAYLNPTFVEGEHRVVLHTLEGQVKRGTVKDLDLLDAVIRLAQPGRPPEAIAAERVKAIFFMQEPGTTPLPSSGRRIRVGFADGRQIVGFSDDVDSGEQGFFLIPADTRTHTARIYVFRAGVQSISAA